MSELLGLAAFVLVFSAAGYGLLLAILGLPPLRWALLALPLAHVLGVAGLGTLLTIEVVAGVPFGLATVLLSAAAVAATGTVIAVRQGRRAELPPRALTGAGALAGAVLLALTAVVLEGAFRASRLQGLFGWDAGSFWVPKAEAIFFTGGLDERHFTSLPGASYPPLVPVVQATAFELLGEADPAALHLVYWSILAGFALAAGLLLSRFAGPVTAWGAVLLVLTAGEVADGARTPQGDFLMDAFLALALVLVVLWVRTGRWPLLGLALVFVAGAALTKREALLALACMAAALAIATVRRRRQTWPVAAGLVVTALAVTLPWRLWFTSRSVGGEGPEEGALGLLDDLDRLGPSVSLVIRALTNPDEWSVLLLVAGLAVAAGAAARRHEEVALVGAFLVLSAAGFVWVMWAFPSLPLTQVAALNPIVRLCGAALIPAALAAPLLLQPALDELRLRASAPSPRVRLAVGAIAIAAAVGYPAAVLAVEGLPRFPDAAECADVLERPVEPFQLVYDRRASLRDAEAVRDRLASAGFVDAQVRSDGCGRWKVVNEGVRTLEQAEGHIADARRAGFSPRLERP